MFSSINTCWVLVAAFLVYFMQAGFALCEAGFTRAKNTGNILMKNMMDFCIGTPCYWVIGFGLMFGGTSALIGGFDPFIQGDYSHLGLDIPLWVYIVFQTVFCATAATIVSGSMAERTNFKAYCVYSAAISLVVYPICGHWMWGGGWLQSMGFHDFAGSAAVHNVGGVIAMLGLCLGGGVLIALIRRHEPALLIGNWFSQPENAQRIGQHLLQIMSGFLELTDDSRIQRLIKRAVHKAIDKVDLSGTSALMLESMTKNNRHQVLLDTLIAQLIALLQRDSSRAFIARQVVHWLETEHPLKAKILPTEWLGEHSAELVSDAVNSLLDDISHDRAHQIRHAFDRATFKLIDKLKHDPEMAVRAESLKSYLKEDEAFNRYLGELWADLRQWVKTDINADDSRVKQRIASAGQWFGETLVADSALRASLNGHLEQAAYKVAPEFATFLTRHISDTVKSWDARDMSQQIELNIGKDLQFIRVNGTLVGGSIGLVLYLLSQIPSLLTLANF